MAVQANATLGGSGAVTSTHELRGRQHPSPRATASDVSRWATPVHERHARLGLNSLTDDQSGTPGVDFSQVLLAGGNLTGVQPGSLIDFLGSHGP